MCDSCRHCWLTVVKGSLSAMNQAGKRMKCEVCGAELVVTKGGDGTLQCDGVDMVQK